MNKYIAAMLLAALAATVVMFFQLRNTSAALEEQTSLVGELRASIESRKNTQRLLAELDTQHTQELAHAQRTNADLRADVAAGRRRLSVAARCPVQSTTGATGLDNAQARAELDPAAAERVIRITNDGDDAIRALSALQDYVSAACK